MAQTVAKLSKDESTKVGAVIVSSDNKKCSMGYNAFAAGVEETQEKWQRPRKYEYVIHAEENAILNCPFDKTGCTIYITHQPCHKCIARLKNAGIRRIVYNLEYKNLQYKDIWDEHVKLFDEVVKIDL